MKDLLNEIKKTKKDNTPRSARRLAAKVVKYLYHTYPISERGYRISFLNNAVVIDINDAEKEGVDHCCIYCSQV